MKKLLAIILLSVILITSCRNPIETNKGNSTESGQVNSTEADNQTTAEPQKAHIVMKSTNSWIFTSKYPIPNHLPDLAKWFPNVYFTYTEPSKDLLKTALTHEYDITINARFFENGKECNQYNVKADTSGIIDNKEKLSSLYNTFSKDYYKEAYEEVFSEDFFDNNVVLLVYWYEFFEEPFAGYEYGFDSESKTLKIYFKTIPHDGWKDSDMEYEGHWVHLVSISKKDITVDGKLVPYDELNIEYSGDIIR